MYLNSHSTFSLRYGVLSVSELLKHTSQLGHLSIALTDINNTSACLSFLRMAPKYNIKPIIGIDYRNDIQQMFIGLAINNKGYAQLNALLSHYLKNNQPIPQEAPHLTDIIIIYPYNNLPNRPLYNYEYIGVKIKDINKLHFKTSDYHKKLVSIQSATFSNKKDFNTHYLLRAINKNTIYTKITSQDIASTEDIILSKNDLIKQFDKYPIILHNTSQILEMCHVSFDFKPNISKNKKSYTGCTTKDMLLLKRLYQDNLHYRYPKVNQKIKDRIEKEIHIIEKKNIVSYFLINWDIVHYAQKKGYYYVGRGSGANSIIAYLLRITDVDPLELDLYFERFINLFRETPPDFDIDFSWKDRQDITQYIFDRFPNTALLATYNTYKYRAAIREIGKVFGLPKSEIDKLTKGKINTKNLDKITSNVLKYSQILQGTPNLLSVHASGIIISENPIFNYTSTFMPPKGFETTQIDMVDAEDIGLHKFDILGQRGLAKIKDCIKIINQNKSNTQPIDIHDIQKFKKDKKVLSLLKKGQAIGCFYIESPAMRMLLKKLEVDNYIGLVAASSIIRPGVAKSGMMRQYILRYRHPHKRKEAHPALEKIMPDTYGIMVYQEDVIKVAHYFAHLTLGEADVLRRGMSGKYRSREEFLKVKEKFFQNCKNLGHSSQLTREIWHQIESFAGYAFAKGHSASYAVESFQSLYLKAHYPLEYMTAVLNNGGGFYRPELYIHEARMNGATIRPPNINKSNYGCTLINKNLYLGLGFVYSLQSETIAKLIHERSINGPFISLVNLIDRIHISLEELQKLIRIDAFRELNENKKELLWHSHQLLNKTTNTYKQPRLFSSTIKQYTLPKLCEEEYEDAFNQIELLGFPLCSPFLLAAEKIKNNLCHIDLHKYINKNIQMIGYLVATKYTTTSKGYHMNFGTFLDQNGHFIDTVHFPNSALKYPFKGRGLYEINGKVVEEFGFISIEVTQMNKLPYIVDPRFDIPMSNLIKNNANNEKKTN